MRKADQCLVRVVAPTFVAGFIFDQGRIVRTAPILHELRGMRADEARGYLWRRGWQASVITTEKFKPTGRA